MTRLIAFLRELWDFLGIVGQQALNVLWWDRITEHHTKIREQGYHEGFQSGFWHGEQEAKDSALAEASAITLPEEAALSTEDFAILIQKRLCAALYIQWNGSRQQDIDALLAIVALLADEKKIDDRKVKEQT